ncbi:MAG: hypothetical protein ABR907_00460 [Terracidiphilus sp.]|jgi:hypothetical protein
MRSHSALLCSFSALLIFTSYLTAQEPDSTFVLRLRTAMTLVDGVAEQRDPATHSSKLITSLRMSDFRLFDNGHEVPIETLDTGDSVRPIALWLIVQCNMGFRDDWSSGFLQGKTQFLKPALAHIGKNDLIGVAHWCDNGEASIDLPPGTDVDAASRTIENVLSSDMRSGNNRTGELAMQSMIRQIDQSTRNAKLPHSIGLKTRPDSDSSRLPVFLFLYGDHSGTHSSEAKAIISDVLESSGIVFGLSNAMRPWFMTGDFMGKTWSLVHVYANETGGEYVATLEPEKYGSSLDYILNQLRLRYTLGFKPVKLDGKTHELRVELTAEAQERFPEAALRFRRQYIPLPSTH